MAYSAIGFLAAIVLIIENQDIFLNRNRAFEKPSWVVYRRFLLTVLVYYVTDIFWGIIESRKHQALLIADTSVYFVAMAAGVLFWTKYAVAYLEERNRFGRFLIGFGRLFAASVTILVIVNIFRPILFSVDDACHYVELPARHAVLIVQILLLLLISTYMLILYLRNKSEKRLKYRTLALFGLVMAVFLTFQIWQPYWPLYAIGYMLGTCLLHAFVIGDEKEEFRRGLAEAKRIAELKESIASLLDNMPVTTYSKSVKTGAYLACNQAFADYAGKQSPQDVVGLTDHDLFDQATADHFVQKDREAFVMNKPYVYNEDASDSEGNLHQFQTTKLKFHDANGRQCLLGMSVDVTEVQTIRKDIAQTKAENIVYESIIDALSEDYFDLYYVNLETDEYIEYGSTTATGHLSTESRGKDFFSRSKTDALQLIHKEDQESFLAAFDKEKMVKDIRTNGAFVLQYRLLIRGKPTYVRLKATCLNGDESHMIIGVNNVDTQTKYRMAVQQAKEERKTYLRLSALTGNLIVLYVIDPDDDSFKEYNASTVFEGLGIEKQGGDFFVTTYENSKRAIYPDDLDMFLSFFTKKNVFDTIRRDGVFILEYRLIIDNRPTHVKLKAAKVEEDGKARLIVGLMDNDAQVRQEKEFAETLSAERNRATKDALTGVKNQHAFADAEKQLNDQITRQEDVSFAVVVCDINDLKTVNDTKGHKAGDNYIRKGCSAICDVFKHSRVFRIGGDEFAVICQGHDYDRIESLMKKMNDMNSRHKRIGGVQIACGMARYENDESIEAVFERADRQMYENKARIKK